MSVSTDQIFLVPGQKMVAQGHGELKLSNTIEHIVVVAPNQLAALSLISNTKPGFRPMGSTTLKEYEEAVLKIRGVLAGEESSWEMLVHPDVT